MVSVLPAATEIVVAIGGTDLPVGVSDACDFPPVVRALPWVSRSLVDARAGLSGRVEFLDGNAYTSRPGPRVVDAAERLVLSSWREEWPGVEEDR